jgi:hypothetical protein
MYKSITSSAIAADPKQDPSIQHITLRPFLPLESLAPHITRESKVHPMRCKKSGSAEGTYEEVEVLVYEIGLERPNTPSFR